MSNESNARICTGTMYGINNRILEPATNTLASDFMAEHYEEIVSATYRMYGVNPERVEDLVHDVYISILNAERNGDCYDMSKGSEEGIISVEEFIYGRIKRYTLNKRYHNPTNGDNEIAASCSGEEQDEMGGIQRVYDAAANYDDLELVELMASIPEEIEYLLNFDSTTKVNIRYFLQHIHDIAAMTFDASLFREIRDVGMVDSDFMTAIQSVVAFAGTNPTEYDTILARFAM